MYGERKCGYCSTVVCTYSTRDEDVLLQRYLFHSSSIVCVHIKIYNTRLINHSHFWKTTSTTLQGRLNQPLFPVV
jgi:hypothetical protein